jgi:RNA polymerase sigma factor (sigma-70 family)
MSEDQTSDLQKEIDRLLSGDESARDALLGRAYERLRGLARVILHQDYPRLENIHSTGTTLHEAYLRLRKALEQVRPRTEDEFFRLSARHIHWVLKSMARRHDRRGGADHAPGAARQTDESEHSPCEEPVDTSPSPTQQAMRREFLEQIEALPADQRVVIDLLWFQGLKMAEVARMLNVSLAEVKLRWTKAKVRLANYLQGMDNFEQP